MKNITHPTPRVASPLSRPLRLTPSDRWRGVTLSALGFLLTALVGGCAVTPDAPTGPIEIDGTQWKMVAYSGQRDGRVVKFTKTGVRPDGNPSYLGTLVKPGRLLSQQVGATEGFLVFNIYATGELNSYRGIFRTFGRDGGLSEEIVLFKVMGNYLNWNLASAIWERVDE